MCVMADFGLLFWVDAFVQTEEDIDKKVYNIYTST